MFLNNISKKSVFTFLLGTALFFACILPSYADSESLQKVDTIKENVGDIKINPSKMLVSSGNHSGIGFKTTYSLTSRNGKKINFWIKNNSDVSVAISINGKNTRILKAGESGHVSVKASYFTKKYKFTASPTPNGGNINIDYKIAQRDE